MKKDPRALVYQSGPREPFWYGVSKVFTQWSEMDTGRFRVYKRSTAAVESAFGFSNISSARAQWLRVVALLNECNP